MKGTAVAASVARALDPDDIVVTSLGTAGRSWRAVAAAQPAYPASDPMGLAPALALGLALSRPDRRVVLLEGDGDLMMNAGVLATIASAEPANLRMVVFQNGRYETGGGRPLAAAGRLRIDALAASLGWPRVDALEAHRDEELDERVEALVGAQALGMLAVHVDAETATYTAGAAPSGVEARITFQQALGPRKANEG